MRNLLIEIGKTMMDEGAFGLMKFVKKKMTKNDVKRLKNAALALLENRSFVYRGALVVRLHFLNRTLILTHLVSAREKRTRTRK